MVDSYRKLHQMLRIVPFLWLVFGLTACRTPEHVADHTEPSDARDRTFPHTFPRDPSGGQSFEPMTRRALSTDDASAFAARLANEQCERQYQRRPFKPEQYPAILYDGVYRWGKFDVAGHGGFSTLVSFGRDGSEPHVEVYFSSDSL
jgi:hypothetical protein